MTLDAAGRHRSDSWRIKLGLLVARETRARDEAARFAELARVGRIGRDTGYQDRRDFGPGLRLERGEVIRDEIKLGRHSTVRGGRVRDSLLDMRIAERISATQFAAVECFRDDLALATGYSPARAEVAIGVSKPFHANFPTDDQIDALARVTRAWDAFTDEQKPVAEAVIVSGLSLRQFARERDIHQVEAAAQLRAALKTLEHSYWGRERFAD